MKRLLLRRGAAGLALGAMAAVGLVAVAAPAQADSDGGYLLGAVTDNVGRPLAGAEVVVEFCRTNDDGNGPPDSNGCYTTSWIDGDTADRFGRYLLKVDKNDRLRYPNATVQGRFMVYAGTSNFVTSPGITVTPQLGVNVAGPTIALLPSGAPPAPGTYNVTGVVTSGSGGPAAGGSVSAYDAATNDYLTNVSTFSDGRFYLNLVPGKAVKLYAWGGGSVSMWYGGTQARSKAAVVVAPALASPATANIALGAEGTISGTIKLPAAGSLWGAYATVYDANGIEWDSGRTDAAGNFSIDVEPGTYYVRGDGWRFTERPDPTPDCAACVDTVDFFDFVAGYYGKIGKKSVPATSLFTATPITVGPNGTVSVGTITLTNTLKYLDKPKVRAKKGLRKGAKVTVSNGTWSDQARAQYAVTWRVGKKIVGTGNTLKLSKKVWKKVSKKPKKLTVTVVASDKYGEFVDGSVKVKVAKALAKAKKKS